MLLLKTGSICLVNFDFAAIFFQFIFHAVINKKRKTGFFEAYKTQVFYIFLNIYRFRKNKKNSTHAIAGSVNTKFREK